MYCIPKQFSLFPSVLLSTNTKRLQLNELNSYDFRNVKRLKIELHKNLHKTIFFFLVGAVGRYSAKGLRFEAPTEMCTRMKVSTGNTERLGGDCGCCVGRLQPTHKNLSIKIFHSGKKKN